jgi:4'-phosphopantetheinyl transferase
MPLVFEQQITSAKKIAVWEITEPLSFFLSRISAPFDVSLPKKRYLEKTCCSFLLNYMLGETVDPFLSNDIFGKPILNNSKTSVSFSHTKDLVACYIDLEGNDIGVDIEHLRKQLPALSKKFMNIEDSSPFKDEWHYLFIWSAKEVLYKMWGKKNLDFYNDLKIITSTDSVGYIQKEDINIITKIMFHKINDIILTYNL